MTSHQSLSNYSTLSNTIKSLSISGKTITYTKGDDTTGTLTTQDTVYTHPTSSGNNHIPSGGSSGQFLGWSADGTAKWVNNPNTNTWTAMVGATSSSNGSVGYVNAVPPKDGYNTKYLRADGTWQVPPDHTYNVYNKTLTIQKNGTNVATFTSNSNTDVTANISVPTKTSDLTNDSGFLTSHQDLSGYIPKAGGAVITSDSLGRTVSTNRMVYCGGADNVSGASVTLYGKDSDSLAGVATMQAYNGTNNSYFRIFPTGEARYYDNGTTKNLAMQEDVIPRSGGAVITGENIGRDVNTSRLNIWGGSNMTSGGRIILYGSDYTTSSDKGRITLQAFDGSENSLLTLYPSGTFTFTNNGTTKNIAMQEDFIPRSGGAVMTGYLLGRTIDTSSIMICGGSRGTSNAYIQVFGGLYENSLAGGLLLGSVSDGSSVSIVFETANLFRPSKNGAIALGNGNYRWGQIYSSNSTISTSDSRLKNTISSIDDNLLDAWESIQPKQYKFNDATETKGEQARFHTGYLAQDIQKACTDNNIDATRYGLFCYDSWEEEPEISEDVEVEKDGVKTTEKRIIQPKREKGDAYSLRYEEALVVECAYLRREISRLKEELNLLKAK